MTYLQDITQTMEANSSISTLLVYDNVDEANRMVSLVRNAGFTIDPQYAANVAEFSRKLQERTWDLVLAQYTAETIAAKNVIHQIRRINKDVPVIFILDEFIFADVVEALKLGAADAAPVDEDQYLIQIISRTLHNLEQRRKSRYWKRRFAESEDRFESLVESSQDGIAIIQEGTYVYVNNAYARFFGFPDADSMALVPVFDTVAARSQPEFKKYLKPLDEHNAWDTEVIHFEGQSADEIPLPVQATLSQIDFHGEAALQLLVKKSFMSHHDDLAPQVSAQPSLADSDISKIRLRDMVEGINGAIRRAAKNGEDAMLFYLQVDHFDNLQKQFGIEVAEEGVAQLAYFIDSLLPEKVSFGRIREEAFALIIASNDTEKGLALANRIVKEVSSQIFNTSSDSFTCTLSIGLTLIGEVTGSADEGLSTCQKAVAELQTPDASGKSGNSAKLHEAVFDLSNGENISDSDIQRIGRQLIKKNLVSVAFQPVVSLHGLRDEFYEVLMRIQPEGFAAGEIPADFIAKVFKTDIGCELDKLVIESALGKLRDKKTAAPHTRLFIHLSQATIADEKFIPWLQKTLERFRLAPADLVFQMREMDISRQLGKAANMLERLRNFGAGTGLTHYGLAINPLTIFHKIAVDYVKVDGVLSDKAQKDKNALANLKGILTELKGEKLKVIVPFIESATIIPTLWQGGVDFLQGHYIQQPAADMNFDFSQE